MVKLVWHTPATRRSNLDILTEVAVLRQIGSGPARSAALREGQHALAAGDQPALVVGQQLVAVTAAAVDELRAGTPREGLARGVLGLAVGPGEDHETGVSILGATASSATPDQLDGPDTSTQQSATVPPAMASTVSLPPMEAPTRAVLVAPSSFARSRPSRAETAAVEPSGHWASPYPQRSTSTVVTPCSAAAWRSGPSRRARTRPGA